MAKKKSKSAKAVPAIVAVVLIVAIVAVFAPRLIHKCDDCGKVYFGTGYRANAIVEAFSSDEKRICRDCAEEHHAISSAFGGALDEYKYPLF